VLTAQSYNTNYPYLHSVNPLRYRSYYYDGETGFYYLFSRYYDPAVGRLISPDTTDVLLATPDQLTDKNLYAYCDSNPVVRVDYDGEFWSEIGLTIAITASIVAVGALVVASGGTAALAIIGASATTIATSTATTALVVAELAGETALCGIALHATSKIAEGSIMLYAEHKKKGTTNPSNLPKHQYGEARRARDHGREAADVRRTRRKDPKKVHHHKKK